MNGRQVVLFTAGGAGKEMVTETTTAPTTSVVSRMARCGGVTLMSLMYLDVSGANDRTNGG